MTIREFVKSGIVLSSAKELEFRNDDEKTLLSFRAPVSKTFINAMHERLLKMEYDGIMVSGDQVVIYVK